MVVAFVMMIPPIYAVTDSTMQRTNVGVAAFTHHHPFAKALGTMESSSSNTYNNNARLDDAFSTPTSITTDEQKINVARNFLHTGNGFYAPPNPSLFSNDFVFRAPVVGPLCKIDYLATMNLFSLWIALPDIQANDYGWTVDPNSLDDTTTVVRCYVRNTGTHTGPLNVGSVTLPPTGNVYIGATESIAITLHNNDGTIKSLTAGYVVDRFSGNGGGLGAVAGILVAIGLPVPKPYGNVFRFSQWLGNTFGTNFGPRTISAEEDLPDWYTNPLVGSEGF